MLYQIYKLVPWCHIIQYMRAHDNHKSNNNNNNNHDNLHQHKLNINEYVFNLCILSIYYNNSCSDDPIWNVNGYKLTHNSLLTIVTYNNNYNEDIIQSGNENEAWNRWDSYARTNYYYHYVWSNHNLICHVYDNNIVNINRVYASGWTKNIGGRNSTSFDLVAHGQNGSAGFSAWISSVLGKLSVGRTSVISTTTVYSMEIMEILPVQAYLWFVIGDPKMNYELFGRTVWCSYINMQRKIDCRSMTQSLKPSRGMG